MRIGAKIRQIRQHRLLTQRELGEKIGLGKNGANRIAQYEMGYRTPKHDQLNKIANALNVSEKTLSLEGDETLWKLLQTLFWLDQEDSRALRDSGKQSLRSVRKRSCFHRYTRHCLPRASYKLEHRKNSP